MKTKIKFRLDLFSGLRSSLLRTYHFIILIILLSSNSTFSQEIEPFGLEGINVNDLNFYYGYLYAATDSGVYKRYIGDFDSVWTHIGLEDKKVTAVYPHVVGPVSWTVTVGISPTFTLSDSALIYCLDIANNTWVITDTGINRDTVREINSIDGFPSPVICGETFAAGGNKLFRRGIDSWYKEVFDNGGVVDVVKINSNDNDVWIGGMTGLSIPFTGLFFDPFIAYSTNLGNDWKISYPDSFGNNICYDLEFDPADTNIVYAALKGFVIKSNDGGITWDSTGMINILYTFYALAYQPFTNFLFAGGSTDNNEFVLFYSNDGGVNWNQSSPNSYKGISCMEIVPTPVPEIFDLYVGTKGDGVFRVPTLLPGVEDEDNLLKGFELFQNYPNPFNPTTNIGFRIANFGFVTLKVYDVLGREVATLVNEEKSPGVYEVEFNASVLSSGVYFYKLQTENFSETRKMQVLK